MKRLICLIIFAIPAPSFGAPIIASVSSLAFGAQSVGTTTSSQSVTFSFSGRYQDLGVNVFQDGSGSSDFINRATTCVNTSESPTNSACTISIAFNPKSRGAKVARINLTLTFTSGGPSSVDIALTGSGVGKVGSFAQVAYGGGWFTTLSLINVSSNPVNVRMDFYTNDGVLTPLNWSGVGSVTIAPNNTALTIPTPLNDPGIHDPSIMVGWVNVQSDGPVAGYGVAAFAGVCPSVPKNTSCPGNPYFAEAVPLDLDVSSSSFVVPFIDSGSTVNDFQTALAIANQGATATVITATARDTNGDVIAVASMNLPAMGHASMFIRDLIPQVLTRGVGIVKFSAVPANAISATALRFNPSGSFTSIPTIR